LASFEPLKGAPEGVKKEVRRKNALADRGPTCNKPSRWPIGRLRLWSFQNSRLVKRGYKKVEN